MERTRCVGFGRSIAFQGCLQLSESLLSLSVSLMLDRARKTLRQSTEKAHPAVMTPPPPKPPKR
eukprot:268515-Amphidinium_carterae.1